MESGCVYGYRKIHLDLRDTGQQCPPYFIKITVK
ncbi:hypothetical protein [Escherichia coli]